MHQPVAEVVQVQAFRRHFGSHQDAHRIFFLGELLHRSRLIHISHGAIKANHCSLGQAEVCSQVLHQKALGLAAARKDHQPVFGVFATPTPIASDQLQQPLIFGKITCPNHRQQGL